jgi:hypothetical protein
MPLELVKIVCRAVAVQRDGDRIVGEIESEPVACYGADQLAAYFERAVADVAERNAAELAAAKPSRRQRRAAGPKKEKSS